MRLQAGVAVTMKPSFGGVVQLGKDLSNNGSTVVRFEMGYGFSRVDFHSGEITVGDTEEELDTLDISKLNVSVHQIHAGLSLSKKIGRKLELGFWPLNRPDQCGF